MCKMIATGRFAAKKPNGKTVIVNPGEVLDLHQDGGQKTNELHVVRGVHRGATIVLARDDRSLAKLSHIDDAL